MSDKDSLFGSPPPSPPVRGRSPSLALPEIPSCSGGVEISQNVGTIALPGSHDRSSELPVFVDLALPSERPAASSLRPPAPRAPPRGKPPTRLRISNSTSRRTRSPSRVPSPPPHNSQTDRTLRDLVGLISHFEPRSKDTLALRPPCDTTPANVSHHTERHPLGTAHNPIEIDAPDSAIVKPAKPTDAVNNALVALAGTVASALKLPTPSQNVPSLSKPTVNTVLHNIKHDPKLIPVLQATYDYLGSVPSQPSQTPRLSSHINANNSNLSLKKRRRSTVEKGQVPAGAGHWDVPFPFPPGQGPNDYPSQWQLDRGRRVLGELLGLFERAFAKMRGDSMAPDTSTQNERPPKRRKLRDPGVSTGSARSDFGGFANDVNDGSHVPSHPEETAGLDHRRMNEWLSSVPALSVPSSIIEHTAVMPSPSPSDPAPIADNLQDLMAILGTDTFDNTTIVPVDDTFDFGDAFGDIGLDENQWKSLFQPGPSSPSINDITALPMGLQGDLTPQLSGPSSQSHEFAIDPVLMALSQPQPIATGSLPPGGTSAGQNLPTNLDIDPITSDLTSFVGPCAESRPKQHPIVSGSHQGQDFNETRSLNSQSLLIIPTMSASSSLPQSRHVSETPTNMDGPSGSSASSSRAQRKVVLLAKAKEYRERLVKAIERAKMERWATIIEGGVLRNLQAMGLPP